MASCINMQICINMLKSGCMLCVYDVRMHICICYVWYLYIYVRMCAFMCMYLCKYAYTYNTVVLNSSVSHIHILARKTWNQTHAHKDYTGIFSFLCKQKTDSYIHANEPSLGHIHCLSASAAPHQSFPPEIWEHWSFLPLQPWKDVLPDYKQGKSVWCRALKFAILSMQIKLMLFTKQMKWCNLLFVQQQLLSSLL